VVAFLAVEVRGPEPILPLALFRNSIFSVSNAAALVIGAVLFAALIYIPLFIQGVIGSATNSGVVLIPLSLGWVATSVVSGQLISRTGRYRAFPIAGSLLLVAGFWLLTRMNTHTTGLTATGDMLVIGLGLGLMYQTYVLAVQNAVPAREMGIATASIQFFRSIGATFAVAAFGSVLTTRLRTELTSHLGAAANTVNPQALLQSPATVRRLPATLVDGVRAAFALSLHSVFDLCLPLAAVTVVTALLLKELPLRTQTGIETHAEAGHPTELEPGSPVSPPPKATNRGASPTQRSP